MTQSTFVATLQRHLNVSLKAGANLVIVNNTGWQQKWDLFQGSF